MGIRPKTAIHIGSHYGQDANQYRLLKIKNIIWCEADPFCSSYLSAKYPEDRVISGVFWSKPGEKLKLWIMPNRAHNSVFEPREESGDVQNIDVTTTTIDEVLKESNLESPIMLVLDVQGAEIEVLQGALKTLPRIEFIVCEITQQSKISKFVVTESEVQTLLSPFRFKKSIRRWSHSREYYDQLFVNCGIGKRLRILLLDMIYRIGFKIRETLRKSDQWFSNEK